MGLSKLPNEIQALIVETIGRHESSDSRCESDAVAVVQSLDEHTRDDLASLRLVNKTLHRLATPVLFRYLNACFLPHTTPSDWAAKLREISQSPVIEEVQRLSIGFNTSTKCGELWKWLFEAASVLPALVHACKKLSALKIQGPPAPYAPATDQELLSMLDSEDSVDLFVKTIVQVLRRVIQNAGSSTLQIFEIDLPLTYDFVKLAEVSTEFPQNPYRYPLLGFMKNLKHLHLEISDNSGPGCERHYCPPPTRRHQEHPNTSYAASFFNIAILPNSLHSLSIIATHILDMNLLNVSNFRNLRDLRLKNVKVSQALLTTISDSNLSTLKSIEFGRIELKSGTWAALLLGLCALPHLERFWIDSCGYRWDGTSRGLVLQTLPPWGKTLAIETTSFRDTCALRALRWHINQVRILAGCEPFTEDDDRCA